MEMAIVITIIIFITVVIHQFLAPIQIFFLRFMEIQHMPYQHLGQ